MEVSIIFESFILFLLISTTVGLIGYDCGRTSLLNITSISLLDVDQCEIPQETTNVTETYVQLLQINEFSNTRVIQCKIEIHRTVHHCGMFSHTSIVSNGYNEFIYEVDQQTCKDMHDKREFNYLGNVNIRGLNLNRTYSGSWTFAGTLDSHGHCTGSSYADPYGSWESVVVQGIIKISLSEYQAKVNLDNNLINLRSGKTCTLSSKSCIDVEGYTFWEVIPVDNCEFDRYAILYAGKAIKMTNYEMSNQQTIFSVESQDITFALTAKSKETVCNTEFIRTEHPKLLIYETTKNNGLINKVKGSKDNLDILAYMNSKFVYVERHIKRQMKELYRDVIEHSCNLERQILKNSLSIAAHSPDEFAYNLMKGPGYMAVIAGEVAHLMKCIPVEVKIKHDEDCYLELPVLLENNTYYLTPKTHILKTKGTIYTCNPLLPVYFLVGDFWYQILQRPAETVPPITLKPMTKPTWKYSNPGDLMKNGIYTQKDLDQLRGNVMFPTERDSLLNDLAREMDGQPSKKHEALSNLLNDYAVSKIMQSSWDRAWSGFLTFGTASAGIIAIFMIFHIFKTVIDIILRGYILYVEYGWSLHLLGAIWSSLASLLLQRKKTSNSSNRNYRKEDWNGGNLGKEPYFVILPNNSYSPMGFSVDKNVN